MDAVKFDFGPYTSDPYCNTDGIVGEAPNNKALPKSEYGLRTRLLLGVSAFAAFTALALGGGYSAFAQTEPPPPATEKAPDPRTNDVSPTQKLQNKNPTSPEEPTPLVTQTPTPYPVPNDGIDGENEYQPHIPPECGLTGLYPSKPIQSVGTKPSVTIRGDINLPFEGLVSLKLLVNKGFFNEIFVVSGNVREKPPENYEDCLPGDKAPCMVTIEASGPEPGVFYTNLMRVDIDSGWNVLMHRVSETNPECRVGAFVFGTHLNYLPKVDILTVKVRQPTIATVDIDYERGHYDIYYPDRFNISDTNNSQDNTMP